MTHTVDAGIFVLHAPHQDIHATLSTANDDVRDGRTVVDSVVWMPYGNIMIKEGGNPPIAHRGFTPTASCMHRRTVVDSVVWMPYGDIMFEDPERLRYLDGILGFAKIRLIDAIERFRVHVGGDLPPHMEHVRALPAGPALDHACALPARASQQKTCLLFC